MTLKNDVVLWDDGKDRLCLCKIAEEQQYKYKDGAPCVTFGVLYEGANYKGYDIFTLFDSFYCDSISTIEKTYCTLNGAFRICDNGADTDGYVDFVMKDGRVSMKGQLGASFAPCFLHFELEADQTVIGALLEAFTV